jgi:thiamine kinase-like enzyme
MEALILDDRTLRHSLERLLSAHFGRERRIIRLERRVSPYSSSFTITELGVQFDAGDCLDLVWKDLSPTAVVAAARGVKPAFLNDPLREIETYEQILAPSHTGALYYGSVVEPAADHYSLFLQKVHGSPLSEIGDLGAWHKAARWLAAFHTRWADEAALPYGNEHLLHYDRDHFGTWLTRLETTSLARVSTSRRLLDPVLRAYDGAINRLVRTPASIVHGDFYAPNVLIESSSGRVCPIDWELTALGPPFLDLAALMAGRWSEAQKASLARSYYAALSGKLAGDLPDSTFWADLACCRLHLAVQWLGWAPSWKPPPEHAHDWLREALALSEHV